MPVKFFKQLSQDLTQILESEYDCNVVIEVGENPNNKNFKAHSAILYQRSLYFRQKIINAKKKNNIIKIELPYVTVESFNIIIKYIYGGLISLEDFEPVAILDLLVRVNFFMLTELVDYIQNYLIENNAIWLQWNFFRVYQLNFLHDNSFSALQKYCSKTVVKCPNMIFDSDYFPTLQENALIALLKNDNLEMEESEIWEKVIQWGKAQTHDLPENLEEWTEDDFMILKESLRNCLPYIRYFQITGEDIIQKVKPYHYILEKNLWDDILTKKLAPKTSIKSKILPPRGKASSTTAPFSSIITLQHAAEISSWIDKRLANYNVSKIPYKFKLLLRGSRDGFTAEKFHELCDDIPGTVVVVKINSTNESTNDEILGGYNPLIWKVGDEEFAETDDSFIFFLKSGNRDRSILSHVSDKSKAIMYSSNQIGPCFGGEDLLMGNDPKLWHSGKTYYKDPIRDKKGWFDIDEFEVFEVCKDD
ncbi:hypothetical protein C2G38_2189900 [Gigaspora rosea]|uniref:Kelch-like protein 17 n=1 Tax=Gigaspora rosea TaxID=44941 RepID=A0A397V8Z6_9GLOM|nr:hypothetical protein C2G38_2189900 [Gigaspora rosea]